jgi:hypothetical protein
VRILASRQETNRARLWNLLISLRSSFFSNFLAAVSH